MNGDTVCDVLQEMADAVAKMPATQPRAVGAKMSFARKTLTSGEKVILGFDGNISGILVMSDGSKIPFTISYVDIN